ncbi:MotA/TolQ/ExbB proton channel family protein [Carboxylicivirga mesophila]|uniref:MotA/TolQ/ExbB proton channel family protein n=1 Tax=Carboxylicivirga mesophila TaxID=1166478 RepID=A0ABS5KFP7_9BACT|nr:MotA/TolQ/ExbB proton channel family protein [Carboxylicivirga mesophila]MBS2213617.1 MotA/TolQ/ExbB proton channel family protein [Carboxylicivirga mesophila]
MKDLFITGGPLFMGILTILLVMVTAWIIYHFIVGYTSKQINKTEILRKLSYGKSIGLFALITGLLGQLIGLSAMFSAIEKLLNTGGTLTQDMVFYAIKVTMIVTMYGILIYLFTLLLWLAASMLIERKE